jgi:TPR repeat protein
LSNYGPALHELGVVYETVIYVSQDLEEALRHYIRAAFNGFSESLKDVERFYRNGIFVKSNPEIADWIHSNQSLPKNFHIYERAISNQPLE